MRLPTPLASVAVSLQQWSRDQFVLRATGAACLAVCACWVTLGWHPAVWVVSLGAASMCAVRADSPMPTLFIAAVLFCRLRATSLPTGTVDWLVVGVQACLLLVAHAALAAASAWPPGASVSSAVWSAWARRTGAVCAGALVLSLAAGVLPRLGPFPDLVVAALAIPVLVAGAVAMHVSRRSAR